MKLSKAIAFAGLMAFSAALPGLQGSAAAQTVVDDWANVKAPPPPVLKSVTVDPKTTAFLVLDFVPKTCAPKPMCLAALPKIGAFLAKARAHNMPVVYSLINGAKMSDVYKDVAPLKSDPHVTAHADKFIGTDLEKILKDKHITTVIVSGVTGEGAALYTASHAAFLGFKVIVPLDGAPAGDLYAEQTMAWLLANAPGVGAQTTLTSFDKIGW